MSAGGSAEQRERFGARGEPGLEGDLATLGPALVQGHQPLKNEPQVLGRLGTLLQDDDVAPQRFHAALLEQSRPLGLAKAVGECGDLLKRFLWRQRSVIHEGSTAAAAARCAVSCA